MGGKKRSLILQIITTSLITIAIGGLSLLAVLTFQSGGPAQPATCVADHCFCEEPSASGLIEPINAVSSLIFVFLGVWGLFTGVRFNKQTKERGLIVIMALTMIFIGISSFFYHGTMSYIGQFFDVFSMYVFAILLSLGSLIRRGEMSVKKAIAIFLIVGVITGYIQYVIPFIRRILFGILLAPGIILAQQPRTTGHKWFSNATRYFYVAAACLTTAYVFWYFDKSAALCMPNSLFQGHAVWHILTALGAYMVILHYKNTSHKITNK